MTRHIADIRVGADENGAILSITVGALRIRLELSNSERLKLCRALADGGGECCADVQVRPLALSKGIRELTEVSLNARKVEGAHE